MAKEKEQAGAEENAEAEEKAPAGSKLKLILIIVGVLVLVGGSVAGTLLIVGGDSETETEEVEVEPEVDLDNPTYIDLKPPFTVNLAPEDTVGFLQISLQILTYNDDVAAEVEKHTPLIRNNLVVLFGRQSSAELRAQEGKERLQQLALETVQEVINKHSSGGEVANVFFTSFVMQ